MPARHPPVRSVLPVLFVLLALALLLLPAPGGTAAAQEAPAALTLPVPAGSPEQPEDPGDQRTIAGLRARAYESGPIEIVRTLATTPQYTSYLIAYPSDGLRVTGYLNVPHGEGPFPVLLVNHGYVPPAGYVAVASNYTKREGDFFAARGYLTAGSDYRGHGNNPGNAPGAHLESAYVVDAMNLLAALKRYPRADAGRVGVWGHSNGGSVSERMLVVSADVDATVIWAGVSADAVDAWLYLRDWLHRPEREVRERWGHPDETPDLYRRMSSRQYLGEVVGPVQIHHGTADASVPYQHGADLDRGLAAAGKRHQLYTYPGAPHNWSGPTWETAIGRSLAFFDANVKGAA
ncbi:MAG TPA: prolyl oligopeptidase family serine peptidase [Chloroflexota bacterium]|nr:prolyl oligopeptidase family serine peptidase [Chloroflexota bacterium]